MADDSPAANPEPVSTPSDPVASGPVASAASAAAPTAGNEVEMPPGESIAFEAPTAVAAAAMDDSQMSVPDQAAIDELLKQAEFQDPTAQTIAAAGGASGAPTEPFDLPNFQQVMADAQVSSIDLLRDVELNVKIELGRSRMLVEDVLKLGEGSVVELDKLAGDPVDVFVNDRLVARGEVLVLNENFCVRVNEIIAGVKDEGI